MTNWFLAFAFLIFFCFCMVTGLKASEKFSDYDVCQLLAKEAEEAFNLPSGILSSIARVESGRKTKNNDYKAWPWTINDNGKGLFFDDRQSAIEYISNQNKLNNTQLDIGCMQISVKWHAHAFSSPESMLDPYTNIAYAAIFLEELYQTHGNWELAIRYYHSAEKEKNDPYLKKVNAVWKGLPEPAVKPATASSSIIAQANPKQAKTVSTNSTVPRETISIVDAEIRLSNSESAISLEPQKAPKPITRQHQDDSKLSEVFTKSQPHLAKEWRKVVHFRKLFASE